MPTIAQRYKEWLRHRNVCGDCDDYAVAAGDSLRNSAPCVVGKIALLNLFSAIELAISADGDRFKGWHI